jgi:hypothetical protein
LKFWFNKTEKGDWFLESLKKKWGGKFMVHRKVVLHT